MKALKRGALAGTLALALGACGTLAPTYERPAAPVPATWPSGAAYGPPQASDKTAADIPWREFVIDGRLRQVIEQALSDSRSLRRAVTDVASARALYRVQRAAQLPTVDAGVSASRTRTLASTGAGNRSTAVSSSYAADVGLSAYEIDLFGRLRSLSEAALESYLASAETARATRISLIAETASAWLTLAADRSRLAISRDTETSAQRTMRLTQGRHAAGVASMVDVRSAETTYQQARADAAALVATIAQDRNALELLAGGPIDDRLLPDGLPTDGSQDGEPWLADVPAGLSSTVLLSRPDVLSAEHALKAANADIGAARAQLFPTLALTASGGVASTALSSLLGGAAAIWSLAPSLAVPIFDGGARRANLEYSQAQKEGALASYELAVQTAFQEVANALAARGTVQAQRTALAALVEAAADRYRLAEARYSRGADTFLNALDAQRTLYGAQSSLVTTRLAEFDSRVSLYRYLGGGDGLADAATPIAQGVSP